MLELHHLAEKSPIVPHLDKLRGARRCRKALESSVGYVELVETQDYTLIIPDR